MIFSSLVLFAIVWGGLMVYFITPFNSKIERHPDAPFTKALQVSLARLILHKKAILAFLLLLVTLMSIWSYFISVEEYDRLHAITRESGVLRKQAVLYMMSVFMYAVLMYLFLAVRWAIKSVK